MRLILGGGGSGEQTIEGEGDLSLNYWRKVHTDFFTTLYPDFLPTDLLELNEFKVLS